MQGNTYTCEDVPAPRPRYGHQFIRSFATSPTSAKAGLRTSWPCCPSQEYLIENPQRTQTAAGNHFNVTRAGIQLITSLKPGDDFIYIMKTTKDQSMLKRLAKPCSDRRPQHPGTTPSPYQRDPSATNHE